ncbi:MAG: IPT/TIG domain-containing protein [Acidobacteria bacterium]|nr:IPT/TIG domain-containing protein [Acidobacteriota bacterium]
MQTKTRLQKPIPLGLALIAVAMLAACSADSPTAPAPSPTPATMGISLVASQSQAAIGQCVTLVATVTSSGGQSAPDNTSVAFNVTGPAHFENGATDIVKLTTAGKASALLCADSSVDRTTRVQVTARVPNNKAELFVTFFEVVNPLTLAIYSIQPDEGTKAGGDRVTIYGRGFAEPVAVAFSVGGVSRNAQVLSVTTTGDEIVLLTPPAEFSGPSAPADVTVRVAVGFANTGSETVPGGFTYRDTIPGGPPSIYSVVPPEGSWVGGEQVVLTGINFFTPIQVKFGQELAEFVSVSADNRAVTVLTPRHTDPLPAPLIVDVTILTSVGTTGQREYTFPNGFTWRPDAGVLPILYDVEPNRGSPRGGQTVTLTGRYFTNATVTFQIGSPINLSRPAQVLSISADKTQITLLTPEASPEPVTTDVPVGIAITTAAGTATFVNVYTYVGESRPPLVYYMVPNRGGRAGGELVTIYGRYFLPPMRVVFEGVGDAIVQTVAADGTSVTVLTPPVTGTLPTGPVNVTLTTQYGTGRDQTVTLANAYTYVEAEVPQLFSISPNSGPVEGGTRVTLIGRGFQYPAQVFFADRQAQVISVNYEQVICYSPSITPTQPGTPTTVDVTVKNQATGQTSNALQFRYGEAMFISGISPNQGTMQGGTIVTIYGQGFVAPVQVVIMIGSGDLVAEVLSVAGTEVVVRTAPVPSGARGCGPQAGPVKVTNLGSNLSAIGPNFTYLAANPLITAVTIDETQSNFVQEYNSIAGCSTPWSNHVVHIHGTGFERRDGTTQSAMTVRFGDLGVEVPTTWVSETEVTAVLPDLTGVPLREISCLIGSTCGLQYVDTALAMTITNTVNTCNDTLQAAIYIRPCDTTCRLTSVSSMSLALPSVPFAAVQGVPFQLSIGFAPSPSASPTIVTLSYVNTTASPASATIPIGWTSPWPVMVTPTTASAGANIIAQVGSGVCAITAISPLFTVNPPAPTVTGVVPPTGVAAGGELVTVNGTNFVTGATVTFGGNPATGVVVVNPTTITCSTPPGVAGAVTVSVTTTGGTGTLPAGFTYI